MVWQLQDGEVCSILNGLYQWAWFHLMTLMTSSQATAWQAAIGDLQTATMSLKDSLVASYTIINCTQSLSYSLKNKHTLDEESPITLREEVKKCIKKN